jgi:outer membrane receptor protein involved in Fe transport
LADRKASPVLSVSYGHYESTLIDPAGIDASQLTNTMNYFQLSETVNYVPDEKHTIVAGFSGIGYFPKAEELNPYKGNPSITSESVSKDNGVELSLFANDDYQVSEKFSISMGLRYSYYQHLGADTVFKYTQGLPKSISTIEDTSYYSDFESISSYGGLEPRISARINLTENQSIKLSYNRMRQYIHQISNTTAPTPIDLWQVSNENLPPQIADNFSLGYFLNINKNEWETSAEVFYKNMQNLVEYKDFPSLYLNNHLETELLKGTGRAYGAELYVRRLKGKWTGWISYSKQKYRFRLKMDLNQLMVESGIRQTTISAHSNLVIDKGLAKGSVFVYFYLQLRKTINGY